MKYLIILSLLISGHLLANVNLNYRKIRDNIKGIREFEQHNYEDAEKIFQENLISNPHDGDLHFNLGNSLYRQGRTEEAKQQYLRALNQTNLSNKSAVYHNLGNVFFQEQDYKAALESYRNAIILDQDNHDSRYNYELARRFLEQSMQEQQAGNGDESESDEESEAHQAESKEQQEEDSDDSQQQSMDSGDDDQQHEQPQPETVDQDVLDSAEDVLRALRQREREALQKEFERDTDPSDFRGNFW